MRRFLICAALLLVAQVGVGEDKPETKKSPPNANLAKMTKLVGTWVQADKDGKPTDQVVSVIKLTAGGSAIHETFFPGQDMEMISVYTSDGPDLFMTHYCVIGNQPRMKANPKSPANQIEWLFDGGTGFDVNKDKHMHGATVTIVDKDHIEIEGLGWEDGKPAKEMCGKMTLVRKK